MKVSILKKSGTAKKALCYFSGLILMNICCLSLMSQPLTYIKTAQLHALNFGMALAPTSDSGYVMVGQDKQFVAQVGVYCYFYVSKIDKCGNLTKRALFELIAEPRVRSAGARYIIETSDNKYLITGTVKRAHPSLNPSLDTNSLYVALVDINGATTFHYLNIYRKPGGEAHGTCVAEAPDGYIACGYVDAEPKRPYIAKLNKADGTVIWDKAFPSMAGLYTYANYVEVFSNGDILLLGSYGNGPDNNFYAMRLSPAGNIIWSKQYDIGQYDGLDWDVSGKITQSGGFLLSGSTKTGTNYDAVVIRADGNGNVLNAVTINNNGNEDRARSVTELANGDVVQVGYTDSNNGNVYSLMNKLSFALNPEWSQVLTLNNYTKGWGVNEDIDRGLVFSGETYGTDYDALFVKTDSMGVLSGCNYMQPVTVAVTPVTPVATNITPSLTTGSYFEYSYNESEKIVAEGSGTTTTFCYNCAPNIIVSSTQVCLNESVYVVSKPIRCSPQTLAIQDSTTNITVNPETSSGDTTFYSFNTAGTYNIVLTINCNGVDQTHITTLVVEPPPVASAGNDFTKCKYESVPMTGTGGTAYQWYNEDFSTQLSTVNPFAANDTADQVYNLVVTDENGCIDTADVSVTVTLPQAAFESDSACLHQPNSFTDVSTVANQTIAGWEWNFGDNSALDMTQNPTHIYPDNGMYVTTLIATTGNGCKDTLQKNVLVYALPQVDFYMVPFPQGICDGTPVQFNDTSQIAAPYSLEAWAWNFGDATPLIFSQDANHLYAGPDNYIVQLAVASNKGCKDSTTRPITINPNPVVNFTANPRIGCEPLCPNFLDSSYIVTGANVQWLWDIGDGAPMTSTEFEHCYINDSVFAPITFDVTLTVTSDSGCVTTRTKNDYITVYPNPVADFNVDPQTTTVIDPVITVVDLSTGTNMWNWNYGDSQTDSTSKPPSHTYTPDTATYLITLITSTYYGCYDTAFKIVVIGPDFTFFIPNAFTPNADGKNDFFFGKGIGIIEYDLWILDRWGNMIFHGDELDDKWDGKANGGNETAQKDVYVWKVQLTDIFNKKHSYLGTVTLVD